MERDLKGLLDRARGWPDEAQMELEEAASRIEQRVARSREAKRRADRPAGERLVEAMANSPLQNIPIERRPARVTTRRFGR